MAHTTHYLIVVHGTFAAPVRGRRQWYELDEGDATNFCAQLNGRLETAGLERPVERQFAGAPIRFSWSGENDHAARSAAAERLYRLITRLMAEDRSARVHLIAHSHGGNVVLTALNLYLHDIVNAACGWYWGGGPRIEPRREAQLEEAMERHETRSVANQEALHALLSDPAINQVGRLVFLGTPFYGKQWPAAAWRWPTLVVRFAVNALSAAVVLYAALVLLWAGALIGIGVEWAKRLLGWSSEAPRWMPSLDVFGWRGQSLLYFGAVVAAFAALALRAEMRRRRRDVGNVYFDEASLAELLFVTPAAVRVPAPPFEALVMSLGLLDEALLALSTEPLVYGLLAPRIRTMFRRQPAVTPEPLGEDRGDWSGALAEAIAGLRRVAWRMTGPVRKVSLRATAPLYRPLLDLLAGAAESFVLRVVASAAFGMPPQEFAGARMRVKTTIDVPTYFREYACDVTRLLDTSSGTGRPAATAAAERYAFLADDRLLEVEAGRSALYRELAKSETYLAARYRGYGDGTDVSTSAELRRIAVMVEHRLAEVVTGFGHVRYYAMPEVVDAIAEFIANGKPPGKSSATA